MEPIKEFSKTLLSLENCVVPRERLLHTPSRQDGIGCELEVNLRLVGCECIQNAGLLLKLPQVSSQLTSNLPLILNFTHFCSFPVCPSRWPWLLHRYCSSASTTQSPLSNTVYRYESVCVSILQIIAAPHIMYMYMYIHNKKVSNKSPPSYISNEGTSLIWSHAYRLVSSPGYSLTFPFLAYGHGMYILSRQD